MLKVYIKLSKEDCIFSGILKEEYIQHQGCSEKTSEESTSQANAPRRNLAQ
jgi:hypothetical protein